MNKIEIEGKLNGKMKRGEYPDGTKIVDFVVESKGNRRLDRFRITATGNRADIIADEMEEGKTVRIIGEIRTGSRKVANAVVIREGKERPLYLPIFDIRAVKIEFPE